MFFPNIFEKKQVGQTAVQAAAAGADHFISGAIDDDRDEIAKGQDFLAQEVVSFAIPAPFAEKNPEDWRTFTLRSQNGSGMCVAQATAKLLGAENFLEENRYLDLSALDIYSRRFNRPQAGMALTDALSIVSNYGACFQKDLNDQNLTEAQANIEVVRTPQMIADAKKYRAGGYVQIPLTCEAIASFISQTKKAVLLFVSFDYNEWNDTPTVAHDGVGVNRHGIAAVDFAIYNGQKGIVIDDSWGKFNAWRGQRFLSESFIKQRVYAAGALLDLKNKDEAQPPLNLPRPKYKFTRSLAFGMTGADVVALQNMLKYENLFPRDLVSSGLFLQVTARAVRAWQVKNNIMDFSQENDVRKIRFGEKSVQLANAIYA